MKSVMENMCFAGVGVLLALLGGYFCREGCDFKSVSLMVIGIAVVVGFSWLAYGELKRELRKAKGKKKQMWNKAARLEVDLPFEILRENFCELAKGDEGALAQGEYLSWNSAGEGEIRIEKQGESDWIALYWVRADWSLTDKQLGAICAAEQVELPSGFRKMAAHGIAIYRQGRLSVYPSAYRGDFEDAFCTTVLQPPMAFSQWLSDYLEEG